MAKSSSHNPSSPEITPKEEPVTLDKPKSLNPFLPADQIKFTFDEIAFTTKNEEAFTRAPTQYKEYHVNFGILQRPYMTPRFSMYVSPPSITTTRPWFATIGYNGEIEAKGTLKKSFLPPRWRLLTGKIIQCLGRKIGGLDQISNKDATILYCLANGALKPNQTEGPPFTDHMKSICNLDVLVDSKAPKPSSQTEEVPQGKKPGAKSGLKRKQSLKHTSRSKTEASKSKTGQSEKETQSSSAKDKSPSHPLPPTPVVGEMHKEAQQATGHDASADSIAEADPVNSTPNDSIPSQQDLLKNTRSAFFTPDSPQDEPIIVLDESEEEETEKDEDTHATSHNIPEDTSSQKEKLEQQKAKAKEEVASLKVGPSYPNINQLTELLVTSLKPELSKLLASHDFASYLPTELKELPSKFTTLSGDIKELKQHVRDMEIELPGVLKEIPTKLETFTSTISSLTSQVAELKNIQWEFPTEFLDLPSKISLVQAKLKCESQTK
ncbi:hypothetical protein Tco_0615813 [Tanacetum coccineum]